MATTQVLTDFKHTVEKATTWGTAIDTSPKALPITDLEITHEGIVHNFDRAIGIRGVTEGSYYIEDTLSIPTAKMSNMPVTPEILQYLGPGLFQSSSAYTDLTNVWTFNAKQYAGLPSVKANEGYFYTLTRNSPVASQDIRIKSAVIKSLALKCDVAADNSALMADVEWIGKGYERQATTSGTPVIASLSNVYKFSAITTASFGAYVLTSDLVGFNVTITNGAKFMQDLPTGDVVFPKWEVTGQIKVLAGSNTEAMKTLCLNNTINNASNLKFSWAIGPVGSAGEMVMDFNVYLTKWSSDYTEGEVITFDFAGCFEDDASTNMAQIQLYAVPFS